MMTATLEMPETTAQLVAIPVGVNLLPDEVIDARRGKRMRAYMAALLLVVVAVIAGLYVLADLRVGSAESDLSATQARTAALRAQQNQFGDLVGAQTQSAGIEQQLAALSATDVNWSTTLGAIQSAAPRGIAFTSIAGTVSTSGAASPATTTPGAVGSLTITGVAPSKSTLAQYVDALSRVKGVSAVLPTAVTTTGRSVNFSLTAQLTKDAFSSRYITKGTK